MFQRIKVDGQENDYVMCSSCNNGKLIKYDIYLGSGNLKNHLCDPIHTKKPPDNKQRPIETMLKKPVPMADRQKIYDSMALWCADNRPFNVIDGNGFEKMIENHPSSCKVKSG